MKRRRRINWKALRIITQILAVVVVIAYFLALVYPLHVRWRPDLLFQLDPLTHIYLLVSGNGVPNWLWAAVAIALLFIVSRIFCGWFCPLGSLLDFVSGIRGRLKIFNRSPAKPRGKPLLPANFDIYVLSTLLVLALLRLPLLWVFDPIVFSFKFLTIALLPIFDLPLRSSVEGLDSHFYGQNWWFAVQDLYAKYFTPYHNPVYADTTIFMLLAAVIIGLEFAQPRFWCRYICPLGALLRLSYRLHPLRRRIRPDCGFCLKCESACHFGGTAENDCLFCMQCIDACAPCKISFLPGGPVIKPQAAVAASTPTAGKKDAAADRSVTKADYRSRVAGKLPPQDISRRLLLEYTAAGFVTYPLLRLFDGRQELPLDFIRPPGVYDEIRFAELCIKCGQCMKVCLTNGLQPALVEAGLSALWTPRLISRLGYCEFACNLCGQVCPSGAIPKLPLEEKQRQVLGIAFFDRNRCIPFITTHNCTVCEEHCPTADKAIKMRHGVMYDETGASSETLQPYVVPKLCIGCGICEHICPLPGLAAVRVFRTPPGSAFASAYGAAPGSADAGAGSVPAGKTSSEAIKPGESMDYSQPYGQ